MTETKSDPLSIFKVKQWTHCLAKNNGKRPAVDPKKALTKGLTHDQAMKRTKFNYGFLFNKEDSYIGIDVDVDPDNPAKTDVIPDVIHEFIKKYPTHAHYSPSGLGLHMIYKVDAKYQEKLTESHGLRNQSLQRGALFAGELFWHNQFLTFTNNNYNDEPIQALTHDQMDELCPNYLKTGYSNKPIESFPGVASAISEETIKLICLDLETIPPSYSDPLVQRAIARLNDAPTNDYEHWLNIGFALADAAVRAENIDLITGVVQLQAAYTLWSQRGEGFTTQDAVLEKWNAVLESTRSKESTVNITFKYIHALASYCHLEYPVCNSKGYPINTERSNYHALFRHLGLNLYEDIVTNDYLVRCKTPGIINNFFSTVQFDEEREWSDQLSKTDLTENLTSLGQAKGFKSFTHGKEMYSFLAARELKKKDFFLDWVESKPWDTVSRVQDFIRTVEIARGMKHKEELFYDYIYKNMLCTVGLHVYKGKYRNNTGIVIFQGEENTRKSSWFNNLMPEHWHNSYNYTVNYGAFKNKLTELLRVIVQKKHIIIDECEILVNQSDAELKALISQSSDSVRPMHSDKITTKERIITFWGTTNKEKLNLSDYGNRRVWLIPIKFCDTEKQDEFDLQQVYAELLSDYNNSLALDEPNPWKMSEDDIKEINKINESFTNVTNLGLLLNETYGEYKEPAKDWYKALGPNWRKDRLKNRGNPRLKTLRQIQYDLIGAGAIQLKALQHAMIKYCGAYTGTTIRANKPFKTGTHADLEVKGGMIEVAKQKLFLMPEPMEDD